MLFTSFVPDLEMQYASGWSIIGLTLFNMFVNWTFIIGQGTKQLF